MQTICYQRDEEEITLVAGKQIAPAGLIARPGARLAGRVLTPDGAPAADVRVSVFALSPTYSAASATGKTQTAADGSYHLAGLAIGAYMIMVESAKQAWVAEPLKGIALSEGKKTAAPDMHTRAGAAVEGTVVDAESGAPVPGAYIEFFHGGAADRRSIFCWCYSSGHFHIRTLPEEQMTLLCNSAQNGYRSMQEAEALHVTPQEGKTVTVVVKLHKGLTVSGMVSDGDGKPAAGVDFIFRMPDNAVWFTSDRFGKFSVSGLSAGKGAITLFESKLTEWEQSAPQTVDVPAEKPLVVHLTRVPLHSVTGRVVDARHHPLAGVVAAFSVPISQGRQPKGITVITGADGGYSLPNIPAGQTVSLLWLEKDGYRQPVNGTLTNDGKGAIPDAVLGDALLKGTVVDAETHQPLARVYITVYHGKAHWDDWHTDYRGRFFYRAGPMQLKVLATCPYGYRQMTDKEGAQIDLQDGKTAAVVLKLDRGLSLSGTVTDDTGQPVAGASLDINQFADVSQSDYVTHTDFATDQQGKFTVSGLQAGKGTVYLNNYFYRVPADWALAEPLDIEVPAKEPIAIKLTRINRRTVHGRVVDAQHHPLSGVTVTALVGFGWPPQMTAITGTDGDYLLEMIPAKQEVSLLSLAKPGYCLPISGKLPATSDDTIADVALAACTASVQGKVCDAGGKPVAGATVVSAEAGPDNRAVTDAAGAFTLSGQPEGELHLVAATPTGGGLAACTAPAANIRITCTPGLLAQSCDVPLAMKLFDADSKLPAAQRRFKSEEAIREIADIDPDSALRLAAMTGDEPLSEGLHAYLLARKAEVNPAQVEENLVQLNTLKDDNYKLYAAVEMGIAVVRSDPELAERLYAIAKTIYDRTTHEPTDIEGLGLCDLSLSATALAELLHKTTDLKEMLAQAKSDSEPWHVPQNLDALFAAAGEVSPEFVLQVYDACYARSHSDRYTSENLLTALTSMAQHDPAAAQRLLKMIIARGDNTWDYREILPLFRMLGKTHPEAALALAKAMPEYWQARALMEVAAFQPRQAAISLLQKAFSAGYSPAIADLAVANAIDPELGKESYAKYKLQLQTAENNMFSGSVEADIFNRVKYAYPLGSLDPVEARLLLETEYARELALVQGGDQLHLGAFPLAMCPLDLHRSLTMLDAAGANGDNAAAQQVMHYILSANAERPLLEF